MLYAAEVESGNRSMLALARYLGVATWSSFPNPSGTLGVD